MQNCLIIDESAVIRKVASRIIFKLDFTVENAQSAKEALLILDKGPMPDIIIVASVLADLPSDEFIRALRARPDGAKTVILASLVEANLGQMTRLKRAGATGFIYKPFDRNALTEWMQPYVTAAAA